MSEEPTLKIWHHRLWTDFSSGEVEGQLILHPQMFSLGNHGRPYKNCTTTVLPGYVPDLDAATSLGDFPEFLLPNAWDTKRAKGKDYEYLMRPRTSGTVHVATRGKGLAIAVGHHCATVNFGFEGHLVKVSIEDYKAIVSSDSDPGPSVSKSRTQNMRSFRLLDKFKPPGPQSSEEDCTLNVLVSVVCADFAYIIVDFTRLVKFHILSRRDVWTACDLQPGSEAWDDIWVGEECGPDWNFERDQATAGAYEWKARILQDDVSSSASRQAIVEAISSNNWVWSGYGEHTSCDVVHLAAIHPFMPARKLCEDAKLFDHLISVVTEHTAQWTSDKFRKLFAGHINSANPFSFHYNLDDRYISRFVEVYRRIESPVDKSLYDRLHSNGLLDPEHTIGEPYEPSKVRLTSQYRFLPVYHVECRGIHAYTVICARPPDDWQMPDIINSMVTKDIRQDDSKTTVSVASFRECVLNKADFGAVIKGKAGRRAVEHTGKVGRPRKKPTAAALRSLAQRFAEPRNKAAHAAALSKTSKVSQDQETDETDAIVTAPPPETQPGAWCKGKRKCPADSDADIADELEVENSLQEEEELTQHGGTKRARIL